MSQVAATDATERERSLMAVTMLLSVLQRAYRSSADRAVAHTGLSHALAWPLLVIGRQGNGARQGAIAEMLGIEGPSLVRLLDQLVAAELVQRRDDPADRRAKTLHLTPAGVEAQTRIEHTLHGLRASLFEGVPDADVAACLRVFATLEQRLDCVIPGAWGRAARQ